jgi:hypothetical protein
MSIGSNHDLHFRDSRSPYEVKCALEREIRCLFSPTMEDGQLCLRAHASIVGAEYDFLLRFEAALPGYNIYSLLMVVSWGEVALDHADNFRKTSRSWFELWTSGFQEADPPKTGEESSQLYQQLCEEALDSERKLDSVAAIQKAIIAALKNGARFRTSHKEGGSNIYWNQGRFVRSDYGDYANELRFTDETEFLKMLVAFFHWEVSRNSDKGELSEIDSWRLILSRMDLK